MWIKICGTTSLEDAQLAADSGADAVGFVLAPSPRRVQAELVRRISADLPAELEKYGVFVDAELDEIASVVTACNLTGVQLHRSSDGHLPFRLRRLFPHLRILGVLHYQDQAPEFESQLTDLSRDQSLHAVLVDSSSPRAVGGTGSSYNWAAASSSLGRVAPHLRLIAAGGLSPRNVQQAIHILRPWGVDVVSGVESTPGRKDPARVKNFVQTARQAAQEMAKAQSQPSITANVGGATL